ncbi:polysaccharide pyruvyl transferase WcaK-like protein [Prosthecobacter fusiformis]|uniref:Polysaccharide pyruvyl transferase WcaK-like protein n=1 Tax=Prosthecobacter fusiformis TaxID=48464 RepID=A0A4R7S698_9BACT|nr:polysaccharide pyruvyl transferase family protein [Prosthecobacter fusiformis]TDU73419.1 polysaccharide pyruvyl transferase WcaK-like protein [Prosthecobacter fusiformis]
MNRRLFLTQALAASALPSFISAADAAPKKKILLRSSWQTENIGDIAHTPGMLKLLETYLPEYEVTLWPGSVENGVDKMLMKRFPKLKILAKGDTAKEEAFKSHDFLLHGSGPGISSGSIVDWTQKTGGKPYGIAGVTWGYINAKAGLEVINGSQFTFFRDSVSLETAKKLEATCPIMEFGPDATFACDLVSDEPAAAWLKEVGLEDGKFVCCIPKLRRTPYWEIKKHVPFNEKSHAYNEKMKEHDIAPLRNAVIAVVRETSMKVLLCPEDASQMKLNKEMIYDKLPADVKDRVVWREQYWLTDFAQGVYNRCAGLFGNEQHSPILCIGHGIPAIVCRYKEQTSKGFMWKDIGLSEWLFDHDKDEAEKGLTPAVLAIINDQAAARAKALKAKGIADDRMKRMMTVLREELEK